MKSLEGGHCPECGQVYITQESWEKYQAEHPPNPEWVAERCKKDRELLRNVRMRGARKLWMNDLEMAIDAYRVWLLTKYDVEQEIAFLEALEAFDTFFGEEDASPDSA